MGFIIFVVAFAYPTVFRIFLNNKPIVFTLIFLFGLGSILFPAILKFVLTSSLFMILLMMVSYILYKKTVLKQGTVKSLKVLSNKFTIFVHILKNSSLKSTLLEYVAIQFCKHRSSKFPNDQITTRSNAQTTEHIIVKSKRISNNPEHTKISYYHISLFGHNIGIPKQIVEILFIGLLIFIASQNTGTFIVQTYALEDTSLISNNYECGYCHSRERDELQNSGPHNMGSCTSCHQISDIDINTEDIHSAISMNCTQCHENVHYWNHGDFIYYNYFNNTSISVDTKLVDLDVKNEACIACHTNVAVNVTLKYPLYSGIIIKSIIDEDGTRKLYVGPNTSNQSVLIMGNKTF